MPEESPVFSIADLRKALDDFDGERVAELCDVLVEQLRSSPALGNPQDAATILSHLRRKRRFAEMRRVVDAFHQVGVDSPKLRRLHVQALIDDGDISAALVLAGDMAAELSAKRAAGDGTVDFELAEARGLTGRGYKQWFVQTGNVDWLRRSLDAYWASYAENRADNPWHGINVVALLTLGMRDGARFDGFPHPDDTARELLKVIDAKRVAGNADTWDRATAMEACIALARTDDALRWAREYVHSEHTDAFELASTVRQLKEVWRLDVSRQPGSLLLPLLEAELLRRSGGEVSLPQGLATSDEVRELRRGGQLEKVFGADSYVTMEWYQLGMERCRAVARLETQTGQGMGTGFLVRGRDLAARFGDELLLLTNAHVVCDAPHVGAALRSAQARVRFECLAATGAGPSVVQEVLAFSPPAKLDFALLRLREAVRHGDPLPLSPLSPNRDQRLRLYAIGYPLGGRLSLSLHDNLLVDFRDPYVHYRTPTDPGSSGSPIFDDQWNLVALHHAGNVRMRRLGPEGGTYEANEGIWIEAIRQHLSGGAQDEVNRDSPPRTPLPAPALQATSPSPPRVSPRSASVSSGAVMNANKVSRLQGFARQIATPDRIEQLRTEMPSAAIESAMESFTPRGPQPTPEAAKSAVEKLSLGRTLNDVELVSLEAIVLPAERPVVFVENDTFAAPESPWQHFHTQANIKANLDRAIVSIGRVELPQSPNIPYGGTAFIVGPDLLMTNRHVAELFATGLGRREIAFRSRQTAAWDYRRERGSSDDDVTTLQVDRVVMIHPYWDMALLRVSGLRSHQRPLRLAVAPPETLVDRDIAVIGYPAKDWRNDSDLQDRIFRRVYNVKRLHPGKIKARADIASFESVVSAMTHDSSTLGGNSGSAVVDAQTGDVVGLHFAGIYLKANYAVPSYELARDPRVVDAGVHFGGTAAADVRVADRWKQIEPEVVVNPPETGPVVATPSKASELRITVGGHSFTVPFDISFLTPTRSETPTFGRTGLEGLQIPVVFPRLDKRKGYDPNFLDLKQIVVELPDVTKEGAKVVAKLDDGSHELKYNKFSVLMHKLRRLPLLTAANGDYRDHVRKINGRKPTRRELTGIPDGAAEKWVTDDRIPENQQLPDEFFTKDGGNFDKGHVVRRDDVCWGVSLKDMQMANGDTFHTTNCTPQVSGFNQSARGEDNWGDLENYIQSEGKREKLIVFAGPVLSPNDLHFEGIDKRGEISIQIPSKFWKIVVASGEEGPEAFGFVLEQALSDVPLEFNVAPQWKRFMKKISEIEKLLFGLVTFEQLKKWDARR